MEKLLIEFKQPNIFRLIYIYLKRVITKTGPHGKLCGCPKWGFYVGLGCCNPKCKLDVIGTLK
jgi:hypothetical protein